MNDINYKIYSKTKSYVQDFDVAQLHISVGMPNHDGEKFKATCEWVADRFEKVIFIVSDTLQRHNHAFKDNLTADDAYTVALQKGNDWLEAHNAYIEAVPNKVIYRHDHWLNHPFYHSFHKAVIHAYETDPVFQQLCKQVIDRIWRRNNQDGKYLHNEDYFRFYSHSKAFLLEELAAKPIMLMEHPGLILYPGTWVGELYDYMKKNREIGLSQCFKGCEWQRFEFRRRKSSQQ